MKYIVATDGGSRGNPGIAGCGMHILSADGLMEKKLFAPIGIATNNVAEYRAAQLGIRHAIGLGATTIVLRADSKLVIEQLAGRYKIKNVELKKIASEIFQMIEDWGGDIVYEHIYRDANTVADMLSNRAMDKNISGIYELGV